MRTPLAFALSVSLLAAGCAASADEISTATTAAAADVAESDEVAAATAPEAVTLRAVTDAVADATSYVGTQNTESVTDGLTARAEADWIVDITGDSVRAVFDLSQAFPDADGGHGAGGSNNYFEFITVGEMAWVTGPAISFLLGVATDPSANSGSWIEATGPEVAQFSETLPHHWLAALPDASDEMVDGSEVLEGVTTTRIDARLSTHALAAALEADGADLPEQEELLSVSVWVGPDELPVRVSLDGDEVSMVFTFSGWNDAVDINPPPASEVVTEADLEDLPSCPIDPELVESAVGSPVLRASVVTGSALRASADGESLSITSRGCSYELGEGAAVSIEELSSPTPLEIVDFEGDEVEAPPSSMSEAPTSWSSLAPSSSRSPAPRSPMTSCSAW